MVLRVDEVWKVAKAGSKRAPSHPARGPEVREGRGGSERRPYPQIKERWPRREARKNLIAKGLWRPGKVQNIGEKVKGPVLMEQIG